MIDFEDYSLEEIDEMEEWQMIDQDMNNESIAFQEKLDMYRNEI